jgi:hypothetical protein
MFREASWYVFLIVSIVIGLGAFGHGYSVRRVHGAIDQFPIEPAISETLYVVWYAASANMLAFSSILIWIAFRVRAGDTSGLFAAYVISVLYLATGICAIIYRHGDPFWALFIVLGLLLLASSVVLGHHAPIPQEARQARPAG